MSTPDNAKARAEREERIAELGEMMGLMIELSGCSPSEVVSAASSIVITFMAQALKQNPPNVHEAFTDLIERFALLNTASPDQVDRVVARIVLANYPENDPQVS